jgi:DNA-binding MarR family transcriptional regulator
MIILWNTAIMVDRKPERKYTSTAFLLAQVGARAAQEFAKALAPLNFVPSDAGILRMLGRSPGMSQQELARRLDMHASRLVAVIDALEERGLVDRKPNAEDRRLYSLELTRAGTEALSAIGQVARAHDDAICAGLDSAERLQLGALLEKVAGRLGLTPGVHPGYRNLGAAGADKPSSHPAEENPQRKS